ncbi:MAG: MotA/TolQ/ExbB proton channel family protein [Verrucomicrobia bacterium]|nr:MotA/TolQ/ExbB proton channel family protein [Verrucomicrobiota bacterium]
MDLLAAGNPFISAYVQSDWFGKGIFWGLFLISALSWSILIYKIWVASQVKKLSLDFAAQFNDSCDLLNLQFSPQKGRLAEVPHPFFEIYKAFKQNTLKIINRNHFLANEAKDQIFLSKADLDLIATGVYSTIAVQHKTLEKNLFVLSTAVTLGPFLGLLGTVWGILLTFTQLHGSAATASMLSGLSMALATTVIGLLVAIPALVGYNYLKNAGKEYRREMEDFSDLLLTSVELQYRK